MIVVGAPGVGLPALPEGIVAVEDPAAGLGPLQGIATGLAAAGEAGADLAFVAATDMPFLRPGYVSAVLRALDEAHDVALPRIGGHVQTLAAAYRTALAPLAAELLAAGERRPSALFARCRVRALAEEDVPHPEDVRGLDTPEDYEAALAAGRDG